MPIFDQRADQVETTLKEVETASVCRTDARQRQSTSWGFYPSNVEVSLREYLSIRPIVTQKMAFESMVTGYRNASHTSFRQPYCPQRRLWICPSGST